MKTQYIFQIALLVSFLQIACIQAQSWQWAQHSGSINYDAGGPVCLDQNGHLYTAGAYFFPYGIFGQDTLSTYGDQDIFVSKMDAVGSFSWSKRIGSDGYWDLPNDMLFESTDNSLIISGIMDGSDEVVMNCGMGSGNKVFLSKLDLNAQLSKINFISHNIA